MKRRVHVLPELQPSLFGMLEMSGVSAPALSPTIEQIQGDPRVEASVEQRVHWAIEPQEREGGQSQKVFQVPSSLPALDLYGVRKRFMDLGRAYEYPAVQFQIAGEKHVSMLAQGADAWRTRCLDAALSWLWGAVQAVEQKVKEDEQPQNVSVCQSLHVAFSKPTMTWEELRAHLLNLGKQSGYPLVKFRVGNDCIVYTLPAGEKVYQDRAARAECGWLWSAIQALEKVMGVVR